MDNNLKYFRLKRNKKQTQLAKKANISIRNLKYIEQGKVKPNVYTAELLAKELNTTVEYLFPLPIEISTTKKSDNKSDT